MERCDFCGVMKIIRSYISEDYGLDQTDIIYQLFMTFLENEEENSFTLDYGQVCRWLNGQARVSPQITSYYLKQVHKKELVHDLESNLFPYIYDMGMVTQKLYELVIHDSGISEKKKQVLCQHYPCEDTQKEAEFVAEIILFSLERSFVKRDAQTKELLVQGALSPVIRDYVLDGNVPKPCRWFCGRTKELELLHAQLEKDGKVFVYGLAGIGKSELAKAYAAEYRKKYTNILYLTYTGDLHQDIIDMDFIDDLSTDSEEERFRKHNRFLRTLKEDTLLIIDNFNTTETRDSFLPVVFKYRCRILFTTRSQLSGRSSFLLEEITDREALHQIAGYFYSEAEQQHTVVEQIIDVVHSHTFAVELASRLLEQGILPPTVLLEKLKAEKVSLDTSDQIGTDKDGRRQKATYYGHIHTLFSLYQLSEDQQAIMRGLSLAPLTGVPARQFAEWLGLPDMNAINDLIELGFIQEKPMRMIALHPMMQEITVTDTKPSVTNCQTLLSNLNTLCLMHGQDITNYKTLFATIENAVRLLDRDDKASFLIFVENVIPYMEKYRYETGILYLLKELEQMLKEPDFGTANDRALLFDLTALYEGRFQNNPEKAVKSEKEALSLLAEITAENALLTANIHANLGGLYKGMGKYDLARENMEQAMSILEEYSLTYMHDAIAISVNYAVLLGEIGYPEKGIEALRKCAEIIKEYNSDDCLDYAATQEATGYLYLGTGQVKQAEKHFDFALNIYRRFYADEPEMIEEKEAEITNAFPMAGIGIAKALSRS